MIQTLLEHSAVRAVLTTIPEAIGAGIWFTLLMSAESLYSTAGAIALVAFTLGVLMEGILNVRFFGGHIWALIPLAAFETYVWSNWLLVVHGGQWSAQGIGPGVVLLFVGFTLLHSAEYNHFAGEPIYHDIWRPEVYDVTILETVAATGLWVLFINGYLLAGLVFLSIALFVEHYVRVEKYRSNLVDIE